MIGWIVRLLAVRVALRVVPGPLLPLLSMFQAVRLARRFHRRLGDRQLRDRRRPPGASAGPA
jgi:hypothetical protein